MRDFRLDSLLETLPIRLADLLAGFLDRCDARHVYSQILISRPAGTLQNVFGATFAEKPSDIHRPLKPRMLAWVAWQTANRRPR